MPDSDEFATHSDLHLGPPPEHQPEPEPTINEPDESDVSDDELAGYAVGEWRGHTLYEVDGHRFVTRQDLRRYLAKKSPQVRTSGILGPDGKPFTR